MRAVFGLILIGGALILLYGLFTGKINFQNPVSPQMTPVQGLQYSGITNQAVPKGKDCQSLGPGWIYDSVAGRCVKVRIQPAGAGK